MQAEWAILEAIATIVALGAAFSIIALIDEMMSANKREREQPARDRNERIR